jgi:hypothetical protein
VFSEFAAALRFILAHCNFRYASVAVVWIEYVCKYMNSKEVNMLLKDFLRHVSPNRACVLFYCLMHIPIFYK